MTGEKTGNDEPEQAPNHEYRHRRYDTGLLELIVGASEGLQSRAADISLIETTEQCACTCECANCSGSGTSEATVETETNADTGADTDLDPDTPGKILDAAAQAAANGTDDAPDQDGEPSSGSLAEYREQQANATEDADLEDDLPSSGSLAEWRQSAGEDAKRKHLSFAELLRGGRNE